MLKRLTKYIKDNPYVSSAIALIGLGVIIIFTYLYLLSNEYQIKDDNIDIAKTGAVGDFIGGFVGSIFSIAGFIFLYLTLKDQREASTDQRKSFEKERFENRYFELLKLHRDNVSTMSIEIPSTLKSISQKLEGQQALKFIYQQIMEARDEIKPFFRKIEENDVYENKYYQSLQSENAIKTRNISLKEIAKINIAYHIVFFGVDHYGKYIIQNALAGKYDRKLIKDILNYMSLKPHEDCENWPMWRKLRKMELAEKKETIKNIYWLRQTQPKNIDVNLDDVNLNNDNTIFYRDNFVKYYGGHQIRLGHYFRHLYQLVNYVNDITLFKYIEKYEYIKLLRAQMSTYEQIVFYFNSLSSMGDIWEISVSKRFVENSLPTVSDIYNKQLITKYNLIKNLADGQLLKQSFSKHYPNVVFEFYAPPANRKKLEELYH